MDSRFLVFGFLEYVVFLFSTTCHEAAHALTAKWGGDATASEGGQVSLNPIPHIRREFFGMVLLPLIGILTGSGLIGYASAPYDPAWAIQHPKKSGLMSLAGPGANFALALLAAILMRIGLAAGYFLPGSISTDAIVAAPAGGTPEGIATVLSVLFSLNLLLGCFNLLPIPPLDGFGALTVFTDSAGALSLMRFRVKLRGFGMLAGILIASSALGYVYAPLLESGVRLIYLFYRFPHALP
jgi:Zn-dependent protease